MIPGSDDSGMIVEDLEKFFSRFLALNDGLPLVLALWCLSTHLFEAFDAFAYLAITSPTKRCGKTRACELISCVCFNPLQTVCISAAALYRSLKKGSRTLLIDEAEYLGPQRNERGSALREILNAGYRKGQEVVRCKKITTEKKSKYKGGTSEKHETYETESHKTFCPKVLVLIGRLQDTVADRCIEMRMERRAGASIERFRFARVLRETEPLRDAAGSWAKENAPNVEQYYQENDVAFLQDREAELWLPLFSVCAVVAPDRFAELEAVARRLAAAKSEDQVGDYGVEMLKELREIFSQLEQDKISTSDLLTRINANEVRPWAGWNDGRGINAQGLARLLRPFRIQPKDIRLEDRVVKGYLRQSFQECWERYL